MRWLLGAQPEPTKTCHQAPATSKGCRRRKNHSTHFAKYPVQLSPFEGVHQGDGRQGSYLDQPGYLPQAPDSSFLWVNGSRFQSSRCKSSGPRICEDCPTNAYYGKTKMVKMGNSKSSWDSINRFWNIHQCHEHFFVVDFYLDLIGIMDHHPTWLGPFSPWPGLWSCCSSWQSLCWYWAGWN